MALQVDAGIAPHHRQRLAQGGVGHVGEDDRQVQVAQGVHVFRQLADGVAKVGHEDQAGVGDAARGGLERRLSRRPGALRPAKRAKQAHTGVDRLLDLIQRAASRPRIDHGGGRQLTMPRRRGERVGVAQAGLVKDSAQRRDVGVGDSRGRRAVHDIRRRPRGARERHGAKVTGYVDDLVGHKGL